MTDFWAVGTNLVVGVGTLALAAITYCTMRQVRKSHESEKRDRQLNEILEWAVRIKRINPESLEFVSDSPSLHARLVREQYRAADDKTVYIEGISKGIDKKLGSLVEQTADHLWKTIDFFLSESIGEQPEPESSPRSKMEQGVTAIQNRIAELTKTKSRQEHEG